VRSTATKIKYYKPSFLRKLNKFNLSNM